MKDIRILFLLVCIFGLFCSATSNFDERLNAKGKISLLRVHDPGTKYGPPSDQIDVDVIIHLNNHPGKAFGFQLRSDNNQLAREGMLNLLRDAYKNDWTISIDYDIDPGKNNGVIMRVWVSK